MNTYGVPAREVGIRGGAYKIGNSQLQAASDADGAMRGGVRFPKSRNARYLGVNVHVGGSRTGNAVKISSVSPLALLALGGVLWFAIRAK